MQLRITKKEDGGWILTVRPTRFGEVRSRTYQYPTDHALKEALDGVVRDTRG